MGVGCPICRYQHQPPDKFVLSTARSQAGAASEQTDGAWSVHDDRQ
jgi:hypothetical protein